MKNMLKLFLVRVWLCTKASFVLFFKRENAMPKGMFVTFEGIDGSGKTTHAKTFCEFLTEMGVDFVCSREPGGTPLGEDIRNFALKKYDDKSKKAELYLFEASRAEHYEKVIAPALSQGKMIVMDRFCDSTLAYQGYGNGNDLTAVEFVDNFATNGLKPDLTFYLDIDPKVALQRRMGRTDIDLIEERGLHYQNVVRQGYLEIFKHNSHRIVLIDASKSVKDVDDIIKSEFLQRYKR